MIFWPDMNVVLRFFSFHFFFSCGGKWGEEDHWEFTSQASEGEGRKGGVDYGRWESSRKWKENNSRRKVFYSGSNKRFRIFSDLFSPFSFSPSPRPIWFRDTSSYPKFVAQFRGKIRQPPVSPKKCHLFKTHFSLSQNHVKCIVEFDHIFCKCLSNPFLPSPPSAKRQSKMQREREKSI